MHFLRRKRRTREHVIADLGVNHVERIALRSGHTIERFGSDYGLDLLLFMYDKDGEFQNGDVRIQVKATDQPKRLKNGLISMKLELAHLRHWLREPMPVIVVAYDAAKDIARWLHAQSYFGKDAVRVMNLKQQTISMNIPEESIFDDAAIRQISEFRDQVVAQVRGVLRHDE